MTKNYTGSLNVLIMTYKLAVGGAENIAVSIATGLDSTHYRPVFCCLRGGKLISKLQELNIPVYNIDKRVGLDLTLLFKLIRIIRKERIDIIQTHSFSANLWGRIAGRICSVPVIIATEHTVASIKPTHHKIIDKVLARFTDKIVAVSKNVRRSISKEEKISKEKTCTIYNGIDLQITPVDNLDTVKQELNLSTAPSRPVVVCIGRLEAPKAHIDLFKAASLVADEVPGVQFLIVGDGSLRDELVEYVRSNSLEQNIIFAGHRTDIGAILSISNIAVISSTREGFSISLLEYMAYSKPIVATDVGGNAEALVDGESGIIVDPGDYKALANSVVRLLKDKESMNSMGAKAFERYQTMFTRQKMLDCIESLYSTTYSAKHPEWFAQNDAK
jgi:glycosyltransferase involved in cell wall biosynthesis